MIRSVLGPTIACSTLERLSARVKGCTYNEDKRCSQCSKMVWTCCFAVSEALHFVISFCHFLFRSIVFVRLHVLFRYSFFGCSVVQYWFLVLFCFFVFLKNWVRRTLCALRISFLGIVPQFCPKSAFFVRTCFHTILLQKSRPFAFLCPSLAVFFVFRAQGP